MDGSHEYSVKNIVHLGHSLVIQHSHHSIKNRNHSLASKVNKENKSECINRNYSSNEYAVLILIGIPLSKSQSICTSSSNPLPLNITVAMEVFDVYVYSGQSRCWHIIIYHVVSYQNQDGDKTKF